VKSEVVKAGMPVSFLSRIFVVPRASTTSIAEPFRALSKIPVSVHTRDDKFTMTDLANRVAGYTATDARTPLIGEYCAALKRVHGLRTDLSLADRDMVVRIKAGPYPYDTQFEGDCVNVIASRLGLSATEIEQARSALRKVKTLEDLRKIRLVEACKLAPGLLPVKEPSSGKP